jgi:hypothetical protein
LRVGVDDPLPRIADGALAVVGDCDGLYLGMWDTWRAVERGPGVGVYDVEVDLDRLSQGERAPLATFGEGDDSLVVGIVRLDDERVRVDILLPAFYEVGWRLGDPVELDGQVTLRLNADDRDPPATVRVGDRALNGTPLPPDMPITLGTAPDRPGVEAAYPGTVRPVPADQAVCRELLAG